MEFFLICVVIVTILFIYAALFMKGISIVLDSVLILFPFLLSLGTLLYVVFT